ncbi:uncharacterized protein CANTADRAFT_150858 [Suhomyces tanzawaensis NRRL Y-17324]|uniref:Uncharacterized protein n=1 Tax=Suhomyces tanzawaensis NRRL Y-17324 TaxID=984487 RepID=A0A1E4SLS7_9ASCO|nr:uncharacterized protein CANTADRAFT_150858 [Suhomyces tanzawaensis NRRL Y-17324]ODV80471.1 hypothetical protein CANTADRAFT_150858 [Suhomyces tanzawaensis NRRL Y-17324]
MILPLHYKTVQPVQDNTVQHSTPQYPTSTALAQALHSTMSTEYSDDIFEFNDDLSSVPQSPSLDASSPGSPYEDYGYNYSYGYSPESPEVRDIEDHFEPFLYECCICNKTHTSPCEHSEDDMKLNNQWLMSNYRKWQTSVVRI